MTRLGSAVASAYDRVWVRGLGRALSAILIGPIILYQHTLSPALPASCKYHPSCSAYAREAIWVHGPFKGLGLGSWRLLRCNPWSKGGVDPVPSRGRWLPDVRPDGQPRVAVPPTPASTPASTSAPTNNPGA